MPAPSKQKTILVVEDEISLLNVLRDKLTLEGFEMLEAKNGEEGLAVAFREHPDLILLDIIMPVMNGTAMLKKLRYDNWGKEVPVILLTNLSGAEDLSARSPFSTLDYIVKSDTKIEDVIKKVKDRLNII